MHLIAKATRILRAKFCCNRLTTVQDIQDYASLIFLGHSGCSWPNFNGKISKDFLVQTVFVWISSKSPLAERFSAEFSNLNLVEVLAEFSLPSSLREHMDSLSSHYQLVSVVSLPTVQGGA